MNYILYLKKLSNKDQLLIVNLLFSGRQFDKHGNLKQWWSDNTITKFKGKAKCIIEQYGNFTVEEVGLNVGPQKSIQLFFIGSFRLKWIKIRKSRQVTI